MKSRLLHCIVLLLCASSLAACQGPNPVVVHQELRPPAAANEPYMLVITIENQSGGEGQAEITAKLQSKGSGETMAEQDETIILKPHETAQVVLELRPSAPGDYEAIVDARYPPD